MHATATATSENHAADHVPDTTAEPSLDSDTCGVAVMPWGVHSEYSEDEGPEVEIDEDQEGVERGEEGTETTEEFDIDDAIANL